MMKELAVALNIIGEHFKKEKAKADKLFRENNIAKMNEEDALLILTKLAQPIAVLATLDEIIKEIQILSDNLDKIGDN